MMTKYSILAALIAALGGLGAYLMLPHKRKGTRAGLAYKAGAQAAVLALVLFAALLSPLADFVATTFFDLFAVAAVASALLMVTARDPVHSALWFASVVLSTGGLFLLAGASFLAAGTIIVYAGAIIVTFLFVIMLAQMEGRAVYDRAAHSPGPATVSCFVLLWCLLASIATLSTDTSGPIETREQQFRAETSFSRIESLVERFRLHKHSAMLTVIDQASPATNRIHGGEGAEKPQVAGIGGSLYTDHLITAGLSGVLLFVALVGAIVITNPRPRPQATGRGQAI